MLYRGIRESGTPVAFYLAPGEKHSFAKLSNRMIKTTTEMAWFEAHAEQGK